MTMTKLNTKTGNKEAELNNTAAVQRLGRSGAELNTRTAPTPARTARMLRQLDSRRLWMELADSMLRLELRGDLMIELTARMLSQELYQ